MEQILLLTKEYSKNRHLEMIQRVSNNVMDELELLLSLIHICSGEIWNEVKNEWLDK